MTEKSKADELRAQIAAADRLRRWSREAEMARVSIRLLQPLRLRWRDRAFGFIRSHSDGEFEVMSREMTDAVYAALALVRDDYERQAAAIERRLNGDDHSSPDSERSND